MMNDVNKVLVDFELKDTMGKVHNLLSYAGMKVYIKFWASWCSICLAGLEEVDSLASKDNDFIVLSIVAPGFKGEMSLEGFKEWFNTLSRNNLTVLLDEEGRFTNKLEVRGYPTSAFIGSDGFLVNIVQGQKSNEEIQRIFKTIN